MDSVANYLWSFGEFKADENRVISIDIILTTFDYHNNHYSHTIWPGNTVVLHVSHFLNLMMADRQQQAQQGLSMTSKYSFFLNR